ncbi:hypothetical protein TPHA_0D03190 [Tetrapisispora phaffii CBS 4417]|uniref:Tafazzin family protein n=1 Tax=Tetrapisispora phaffii (strain ATCC 24235 / CBS 4417 / NBRC 1672 / NRRL Y-8282 / UCD 70-5) TaxID=1071381 RepID=G8BSY4_TETPH|nr:hypothetical protein TPHA_0D03190 [Tetrapisispora phaffii CBS 4417]CCE62955.1 hypothetical protein TPHA_0D03190 [Tetrapisispora phaffii CBS 4417]
MSQSDVLQRGDDFLMQYPRNSKVWKMFSHFTCLFTVGVSKLIITSLYNVELNHFDRLERAIDKAHDQNRGIMTVMNHMSVIDDPFIWAVFPWKTYRKLDNIRWCLGAHNVCFTNKFISTYFSLGQTLSTERFGAGPFQGSIDATVRLLSPDETLKNMDTLKSHFKMNRPAWVHVYPEGFVLQLQPPFSNSMRYFKWGITRMILESTRQPVIVPIFTTGFENIAPEDTAESPVDRYLPAGYGTKINVTVGKEIDEHVIENYRAEWSALVEKYKNPDSPHDLTDELKWGKEAQELRSRVAATLRENVAKIRHEERGFPQEDKRFKSPQWWKRYTTTEGASDPDVKFIGKNWAIRRLQSCLTGKESKDSNK